MTHEQIEWTIDELLRTHSNDLISLPDTRGAPSWSIWSDGNYIGEISYCKERRLFSALVDGWNITGHVPAADAVKEIAAYA